MAVERSPAECLRLDAARDMLLDRTGLDGYYSINMFIPSDSVAETNTAEIQSPTMPDADRVRDALRSQLGLTVEKQTAPVKVLVIDRVETVPTEN
jgi:uncharacterized protein (TIGR03435 family)